MAKSISVTGLGNLKRAMKDIERSMPNLRAETLNNMAFHSFTLAREVTIPDAFEHLRNNWTINSVRFVKAKGQPGSFSATGSIQPYMATQEFGDRANPVGHVPTNDARVTQAKPRVVAGKNRTSKRGNFPRRGLIKGNRNVFIAIKKAQREGDRGPFEFEINGAKGVQRGLYRFKGRGFDQIRMIHNTSIKKVSLKKRPWLAPTLPPTMKMAPKFFLKNFERRLKKF